jgi:hypothetical protein
MSALEQYVRSAPSPQNALDIFQGEWSSRLPEPFLECQAGPLPLFTDPRIYWGVAELGGVAGQTVLELGPLEGGHSYMLERLGAADVLAIEANTRAYLRCLVVKEILGLKRTRFLCGDFMEYFRSNRMRFDVAILSGVLYHLRNPVQLLAYAAETSERLLIWTHYHDQDAIAKNPDLARRFVEARTAEEAGFRHTLHVQAYGEALRLKNYCAGTAEYSCWLNRHDILAALRHLGFTDLRINFEQTVHPHGPSFAIAALRPARG